MATFTAAFTGTICATCDEKIHEGDEVAYDGTNRLNHVICPEIVDVGPVDACPDCHLTLLPGGSCGYC